MVLIDTHTHLYLEEFNDDRKEVVKRALENNVRYMLFPNIDSFSAEPMMNLCEQFPENCFPMMGLHPTSVKENYKDELNIVEKMLNEKKFYGIGETGIDLYWDKTFIEEQKLSFSRQVELAKEYDLPVVIHSRDSFDVIYEILLKHKGNMPSGVFHCFTGNYEQAQKIIDLGLFLGIGGVLTFKNSGLDKVISGIDLKHIIIETDSPYLTPTPFRGKRNESSYVKYVAEKLAVIKEITMDTVADITTENAIKLFKLPV